MQQDFARPVKGADGSRSRAWMNHMHQGLMIMGFVVVAWTVLFGARMDVSAYATSALQEEWLEAELIKPELIAPEQSVRLKPGDTAEVALKRLGFTGAEAASIIAAAKAAYALKMVIAGREIRRIQREDGTHVFYNIDANQRLHLHDSVAGWQAELEPRLASSRILVVDGEIQDSLFIDAAQAGLDDRTTMNLVDIYAWDIDFAHDLRVGDQFHVLLEESYDADGNALARTILAAEFVNRGEVHRTIRFEAEPGHFEYYTPEGKNLRKAYLRSPVKYSRISSRYSSGRKHPVLGYTRAHKGVDYAAPTGTPVRAIGDGTVVFKARKGGYGRFVEVRHVNPSHSTAYAHLSRYAKGVRSGKRVRQGQVIGYVGSSGLATGPHLHFEFHRHGHAVNPLTIKRPPGKAVPSSQMANFNSHAQGLLASLERGNMLAWN
jgi:murein DD-endopeptidase MepM/ murein hydrolase activator NlpD